MAAVVAALGQQEVDHRNYNPAEADKYHTLAVRQNSLNLKGGKNTSRIKF